MRHFIAYHNTEKMGRKLSDGQPLRLLTNKPVKHLLDNYVWFVTGEGEKTRQFSLGSVFQVSEVGEANDDMFKHFAVGSGHALEPPVPIDELDWFPALLRLSGHFGLGVQELKDETVIVGLKEIAGKAGFEIPD